MLTKVGPHEHSSVQQHFTSLLVSSMVANKDNMYWCYLPTIASIQGHPGKKTSPLPGPNYFMLQILDQRLT